MNYKVIKSWPHGPKVGTIYIWLSMYNKYCIITSGSAGYEITSVGFDKNEVKINYQVK